MILVMDARVAAAISLMNDRLTDRLSIKKLSIHLNLSSTRLRQLFKKETGRSPIQYFRDLRLQRAETLLQVTRLSIKQVTFLCGMIDVSHFVRDFKKKHGRTPSEYRSEARRVLRESGS